MTDHEYTHTIDRAGWPAGPWDSEGDRFDFRYRGLPCLALRGPLGSWCGYVGVYPGHPAYKVHYDDIPVSVHGGLTYSDHCHEPICHEEEPGERPVWWAGFDTSHAFDLVPGMEAFRVKYRDMRRPPSDDTYRDLSYVIAECKSLADQLLIMRADQIVDTSEDRARGHYYLEYTLRQRELGLSFDQISWDKAMAEYELMKTKLLEAPKEGTPL